jgi:hypothetical protein
MDADTVTHSMIPLRVVQNDMCPRDVDFLYLGRPHKYSECGFMVFKTGGGAELLLDRVIKYYTDDTFVHEAEWHDSWLFDRARIDLEASAMIHTRSLTSHLTRAKGGGHPFVNSFLGQYMDHLKGDARKATGRPRKGDMIVGHRADYWRGE